MTMRKSSKLWKFENDGMSPSMMGLFLDCREQFRLRTVEGWVSKTVPLGPAFGTCMHWILERIYAESSAPKCSEIPSLVNTYQKQWMKERKQGSRYVTQKEIESQERIYAMAEAMAQAYVLRYRGDWIGKYVSPAPSVRIQSVEALETPFKVPFTTSYGTKTFVRGTRDMIVRSKKGKMVLFDHKCYSRIDPDTLLDALPLDLQQMTYLWSMWKEYGEVPEGIVLNVIRRPQHYLKKDESLERYRDRILKDAKTRKRWSHFFSRYTHRVVKSELRRFEQNILRPTMDMVDLWVRGTLPHGMNPNALTNKYGKCSLFYLLIRGEDPNCFRLKNGVLNYQKELTR